MKRVTTMDVKLVAHPVAMVKKDHHTTIRISTWRAPNLSPRYPLGISNSACPHRSTNSCWHRGVPVNGSRCDGGSG